MAVLTILDENKRVENMTEIEWYLGAQGIEFESWDLSRVAPDSPAEVVLAAYAPEIEAMKQLCGFVTADVIDVNPQTPDLEAMLAKFDKEHTHSDDEVRFILAGSGIFFLNLAGRIYSLEVGPGDMLRVPRGTTHWFTLCGDRSIRAVRWFQDPAGWSPNYTNSGVDQNHEPLCFGPAYLGKRVESKIQL